jgi:quinol monooxygenase YgiN
MIIIISGGKLMMISITTASMQFSPSQAKEIASFLKTYLPQMRKVPGVIAIYHYSKPENAGGSTIAIWENEASLKQYRDGDLFREAITFMKKVNVTTTREAYPIDIAL